MNGTVSTKVAMGGLDELLGNNNSHTLWFRNGGEWDRIAVKKKAILDHWRACRRTGTTRFYTARETAPGEMDVAITAITADAPNGWSAVEWRETE